MHGSARLGKDAGCATAQGTSRMSMSRACRINSSIDRIGSIIRTSEDCGGGDDLRCGGHSLECVARAERVPRVRSAKWTNSVFVDKGAQGKGQQSRPFLASFMPSGIWQCMVRPRGRTL